jgi:hypothetical protein
MKRSILILSLLAAIAATCPSVSAQGSGPVVVERVYVTGNVMNPQEVLFSPKLTLSRALAWAGGVLGDTDMRRVKIKRDDGTKEGATFFVNLKAIREGKRKDFILEPFDVVCVPDKKSRGANCHAYVMRRPARELPLRVIQ